MNPGDIVEFQHHDAFVIGVVTDLVGATKLALRTSDGVEARASRADVSLHFQSTVDVTDDSAIERRLALLDQRAADLTQNIDLEALWELCGDGDATLDSLVDLMFGENDDASRLSLVRALRGDRTFFKELDSLWRPRDSDSVAAMKTQLEAEKYKHEARDRFIQEVVEALAAGEDAQAKVAGWQADPLAAPYLESIQEAALAEDISRVAEAVALVAEIDAKLNEGLSDSGQLRAFNLLVRLGIWDEHQNISVLRAGLNSGFDDDVLAAAEQAVQSLDTALEGRADFTDWFTITIDDSNTRDVDDAISVRPTLEGGWDVAIHIADPSAVIEPGSMVDRVAQARGTSVYVPTGTIPMLPPVISERAVSLVEGKNRPAVTLLAHYDEELCLASWSFQRSTIRVNQRLSYREADELLDSESLSHVAEILGTLNYLAEEQMMERAENGAITIDLPEPKLRVTFDDPPVVDHRIIHETRAHCLIRELMVLYNHLAAQLLDERGFPAVYRVQEGPDRDQVQGLYAVPEGYPREFARLKTMRKGEVSTYPGRHFGLGIDGYVQVSSPIRRFGDMAMQRQLVAAAEGVSPVYTEDELMALVADVEQASYIASTIQRESAKYWMIYLLSNVEHKLAAQVLDVRDDARSRSVVLIHEFGLRAQMKVKPGVQRGDEIQVKVERTDPRRDLLTFRQVD